MLKHISNIVIEYFFTNSHTFAFINEPSSIFRCFDKIACIQNIKHTTLSMATQLCRTYSTAVTIHGVSGSIEICLLHNYTSSPKDVVQVFCRIQERERKYLTSTLPISFNFYCLINTYG